MAESNVITIQDSSANPAPLGLLAFGTTTVLLNLHNAGLIEMNTMILSMGIFYGGIAQVIAGVLEWKKNNTFGTTAFTSYGMFWLTLVGFILLAKIFPTLPPPSGHAAAAYLGIWGIFTTGLFIATLRISRALQFIFFTLLVLFFLLAAADYTGNKQITVIAGYEGLVCGLSAMYAGFALVINEAFEHPHLPLGHIPKRS